MADEPMEYTGVPPIAHDVLERTIGAFVVPGTIIGGGGGAPTTITFVNRVWDVQAGPGFVRWETIDAADPAGTSYPGPGTFGVDTSDYCIEYTE